ncbi:MAG: type II toxin-antitoxin system RelE/ParE family toxin [Paracoccus aminovorans]|nr:type II toxin-antitoxin system RelE/ParE family toxin [Paracoccus aminovorans]
MTRRLEIAAATQSDHIIDNYISFGEIPPEAQACVRQRLDGILDDALRIASAPHRGAGHDDLLPELRHLALGKATLWFTIDAAPRLIRILAVFLGAQDQQRRTLIRLLEPRR